MAKALQHHGYAARSGSFGQPLVVEKGPGYLPVNLTGNLPGYTEQEIVVADLAPPDPQTPTPEQIEPPGPGAQAVWARTSTGLIDSRPVCMWHVRDDMDRIHRHGGVFILFADSRFDSSYVIAQRDRFGNLDFQSSRPLSADNWGLLPDLQWLLVSRDSGEEMDVADNGVARAAGIENYFNSGHFECTVKPSGAITNRWDTLATNKYGDPVGGIILPAHKEQGDTGLIFILPQVQRRADLVTELVERVLPAITPRLFPHAEGTGWTRRPEYDLPRVTSLKNEIVDVEETARVRVRELEEQIEDERAQHGFLHDLLTASGEDLVQAVIRALKTIGFSDVRDADADVQEAGQLREDVRIMDAAKPVLVEVKGITGTPKEASSLQVTKYLVPRMREWDRTDLHGLAVINHQRHLPALDREHEHVFQADVLSNAEEQGFGLLTTWDLFRLVRGFIVHGWRHDDVAGLFVTRGRIRPVPAHYELIGSVDGYWSQASALGLRLQSDGLRVGDRIAYELPVDFVGRRHVATTK